MLIIRFSSSPSGRWSTWTTSATTSGRWSPSASASCWWCARRPTVAALAPDAAVAGPGRWSPGWTTRRGGGVHGDDLHRHVERGGLRRRLPPAGHLRGDPRLRADLRAHGQAGRQALGVTRPAHRRGPRRRRPWLADFARCLAGAGVEVLRVTSGPPGRRRPASPVVASSTGAREVRQAIDEAGLSRAVVSLDDGAALTLFRPTWSSAWASATSDRPARRRSAPWRPPANASSARPVDGTGFHGPRLARDLHRRHRRRRGPGGARPPPRARSCWPRSRPTGGVHLRGRQPQPPGRPRRPRRRRLSRRQERAQAPSRGLGSTGSARPSSAGGPRRAVARAGRRGAGLTCTWRATGRRRPEGHQRQRAEGPHDAVDRGPKVTASTSVAPAEGDHVEGSAWPRRGSAPVGPGAGRGRGGRRGRG